MCPGGTATVGSGDSVLACAVVAGAGRGGRPGRPGRSVAPAPPGTLTFSDMNMLSRLPLMGSAMHGVGTPFPEIPGWRAGDRHIKGQRRKLVRWVNKVPFSWRAV